MIPRQQQQQQQQQNLSRRKRRQRPPLRRIRPCCQQLYLGIKTTILVLLVALFFFSSAGANAIPTIASHHQDDHDDDHDHHHHEYHHRDRLLKAAGTWHKMQRLDQRDHVVPHSYIVLLYDVDRDLKSILRDYHSEITVESIVEVYRHALQGFAVQALSTETVVRLTLDDRVELVSEDGILDYEQQQDNDDNNAIRGLTTQSEAPWHLDRIDGTVDNAYNYRYDGSGIDVYIIDSGIRATHNEFNNNRINNSNNNVVAEECFAGVSENCNSDLDSHGTHVAGIVGGWRYGVAKGVTLHDVRIRDDDNIVRWAYLYAAFDYVILQQRRNPNRKLVANVSYTGGVFEVADRAAQEVVDAGVILIVAAGNQGGDSCQRSPGRLPGVIAVGNTMEGDMRAPSSNTGACISIWAPGTDIEAASFASDRATLFKSGTSMAAPMVAGAVAVYLSAGWAVGNLLADAEYIEALSVDNSTTGKFLSLTVLNQGGTRTPTISPSSFPSAVPTSSTVPTSSPTEYPTPLATVSLLPSLSLLPTTTGSPTQSPTIVPPTRSPTQNPTITTDRPTEFPTFPLTERPTLSLQPTTSTAPTAIPSLSVAPSLSALPTNSQSPTVSVSPSLLPSVSQSPSSVPTISSAPTESLAPTVFFRAGAGGIDGPLLATQQPTETPTALLVKQPATESPLASEDVENPLTASEDESESSAPSVSAAVWIVALFGCWHLLL